jgi:ribosomal protein S5
MVNLFLTNKKNFGGARVFLIPASHGTGLLLVELFVQF